MSLEENTRPVKEEKDKNSRQRNMQSYEKFLQDCSTISDIEGTCEIGSVSIALKEPEANKTRT